MYEDLTSVAKEVLQKFGAAPDSIPWEQPEQAAHGDIATPVALQVAKSLGKNPKDLAEALRVALEKLSDIEKVEIAGPGYVNVWLRPSFLVNALEETGRFCRPQRTRSKERPTVIEYSQPNIAKPMGIHHIMSTLIGQALANLSVHLGNPTITVNHIGDWGTQFGKLAVAFEKWGSKTVEQCSIEELLDLYVRFHNEAEAHPEYEDEARAAFARLEKGDKAMTQFWRKVVDITMKSMNRLYERLDVHIEHPHGEAMYKDAMTPILEEGLKKGVFKEGEKGAIVVEFPPEWDLPTAVVQKGDSATIYLTRDFAQIRYRTDRWHPQAMYYVVDVAQSLHFRQLFASVKLLGWEVPHLEHIVFGRMRFKDRSMSTRKGNILRLEEVLDEAVERARSTIKAHGESIQSLDPEALAEMMGIGSVAYGVLQQNRKMDMVFDWDKFLSFEGNSAPYLQYTHARARSVLRKSGKKSIKSPKTVPALTSLERELIKVLLPFGAVLKQAHATHMPHLVANYLYQLCQTFNTFYNTDPILRAEEPMLSLRLFLTSLTATVLQTGASLLTLRVPESM